MRNMQMLIHFNNYKAALGNCAWIRVKENKKHQTNKKESFTSDGIEALKPFESSMNEEKTQSS